MQSSPDRRTRGISRRGFLGAGAAAAAGLAVAGNATSAWADDGPGSRSPLPAPHDPATVPTALMTALRDDALGVTTATPRLWWQVPVLPGVDSGMQTGYEIQLTRYVRGFVRGARTETTGLVSSADSTAVAWPFAALDVRGVAHWRVRVRVGRGRGRLTDWSAPARVVLGPLADVDWGDAQTIWAAKPASGAYVDATLQANLEIQKSRASVFIRMSTDLRNGYMWQLVAGSPGVLRRHVVRNGTYTVLQEVTLSRPIPATGTFAVRVEAAGDTVRTYLDGTLVDQAAGIGQGAGAFGFRTGSTESFWVDDLVISDPSGVAIFRDDFGPGAPAAPFGTVQGGRLLVGTSQAGLLGVPGADDWAFVRREFTLPSGTVAGAYLYATAQSPTRARQNVYRAWCNGSHVGVGPARSVDAPRYQVHDVTTLLRAGQPNALAFQCWAQTGQQVQALLDVHYADGRIVTVASGPDWSARSGGLTLPWAGDLKTPYYHAPSEAFDARHESVSWRDPGYGGTDFSAAMPAAALTGLAPGGAADIVQRERRPLSVTSLASGQWLLDTSRELSAGLRLTLDVPAELAGSTVELRMGEERNADGSVKYQLRAQTTYRDVWTLRAGTQTIEHWGYRTFRWMQLIADPSLDIPGAVTLLEQVVPQPDQVATFSSSNPDLDKVWALCAYTFAANRQDVHMDSSTRERDAYEGDLVVHGRGEMALTRSYDIVRQTNRYLLRRPAWPTEYKFMTITTAWEEYLETGDLDALAADWDRHVAEQGERWLGADGLIHKTPGASSSNDTDIVDWPASQRDGYVFTQVNTVVNAWQHQAFLLLERAATALGKDAEAARYHDLAATMRTSLNAQFYDADLGAYRDGEGTTHHAQHASLYAASLGVADPPQLAKIANWLVSDTANPVRVSANAAQWLLEALFAGGRADAALEIMTSRRDASWLAMTEQWGATQTMEAWSPTVKSNTTFSHPWTAGPLIIVARHLLGVRVLSPGGGDIEVAPQPASLAQASGSVVTARGLVSVDIEQTPRYRVSVTLPGNTRGTLRWPRAGYRLANFTVDAPGPEVRPVLDGDSVVVPLSAGTTFLHA